MQHTLTLPLTQTQHLAWLEQDPPPATSSEALGRLWETVRQCLEAANDEQWVLAQTILEDSLIQVLVAMKSLGIQPDYAMERAINRLQSAPHKRVLHVFGDRAEIRVHGEIRGTWALDSQQDYQSVVNLAREFGCTVIHEEACQLDLFRDPTE